MYSVNLVCVVMLSVISILTLAILDYVKES